MTDHDLLLLLIAAVRRWQHEQAGWASRELIAVVGQCERELANDDD